MVETFSGLSVVIPAYNHERFVAEAVASVRAQSLRPSALVVVDDGSTDRTAEVLADETLPGMVLVRQENQGAHAALNRAISLCGGEWVGILNSDDVFGPHRLEHALGVARAMGAGLVLGRVRLIGDDGAPLSDDHPTAEWYREALAHRTRAASLGDALAVHNVAVTTSNFFVHKEVWRRLGGFRPYRYVHDYDFLLRAMALAPERVVFEDTLDDVAYRVHAANTINEDVPLALAERARMVRERRRPVERVVSTVWRALAARPLRAALDVEVGSDEGSARLDRDRGSVRCGLVVPSLDSGGLEEVVALLAQGLPRQGLDTHVLCTDSGGRVAKRLTRSGVSVTVASTPADRRRWLERVRPQVLSTHFVAADVLAELALAGVPAVETVHNVYAWLSSDDWRRERDKQAWLRGLIAVSATAGTYYQRRVGSETTPLHIIPNGVVPHRVCSVPRAFARRVLGLPQEAPVLLQVGRVTAQKNQAGLLAAFQEVSARHPDAVLLLAGDLTEPMYVDELRRRFAPLFASGRVRLERSRPDVGTLLSAADAFVADSWFEGWSLGATEALWTGIPLVVSDCGGSRELVGADGERGTVVPNPAGDPLALTPESLSRPDPESVERNRVALTAALLDVLAHRETWAHRRGDIRTHARAHFGSEHVAAQYARALRGVLD